MTLPGKRRAHERRGAPAASQPSNVAASTSTQRSWLHLALFTISLAALFGPALVRHMLNSADPYTFNDDVRQQIYPFLSTFDPRLFPNDLPARYYLDCFPLGYRLLYTSLSHVVNPITVSKVVPYLLLLVVVVAVGLAAYRFSGWTGAWFAVAFCLSSPYFLSRLAGGLPRGFGLALVACAIAALFNGRMYLLAVMTVLCAGFYAPGAVLGGLSLAAILFLLPAKARGEAATWSMTRRAVLTLLTMLGCMAVLLPTFLATLQYGATLTPRDVLEYPEIGPFGRYDPEDRAPFDPLPTAILKMLPEAFRGQSATVVPPPSATSASASTPVAQPDLSAFHWLILISATILAVRITRRYADAQRVVMLFAVICVTYVVSRAVAPLLYLPQRYTAYTIPLLAAILLPAIVHHLATHGSRTLMHVDERQRESPSDPLKGKMAANATPPLGGRGVRSGAWTPRWRERPITPSTFGAAATAVVCGLCLVLAGGLGNDRAGLVTVAASEAPIYDYVNELPYDAHIAAWPSEIANNIPYLGHRSVLINPEIHQVFHHGYADEMRRRMLALIHAYYAVDNGALIELRDEYDIRYLLVDERHFTIMKPRYFMPFDEWIREAQMNLPADHNDMAVFRLRADAMTFQYGPIFVLDLSRIPDDGSDG